MKKFSLIMLAIVLILIPIIYYGGMIVRSVEFSRDCTSYLSLSANANSVEIAEERLTAAIDYLEENNLTSGDCKFFVSNRPENDIGYWYNNLKSAQTQLREIIINNSATELEKSNVLMKLRETLLDDDHIVTPTRLWIYPNQTLIISIAIIIWAIWIIPVVIFL